MYKPASSREPEDVTPADSTASPDWIAGIQCPLCGGTGRSERRHTGVALRLCRCVHGGATLLAWAHESERSYEALYETPFAYHVAEQHFEGQPESVLRDEEHIVASLSRMAILNVFLGSSSQPRRLIDIGSGTGSFIHVAREAGYEAYGLEPSPDAREWAESRNRPTLSGSWRALSPQWDIITLHDVLEHLTRPLACLLHLRRCLHPKGYVVVEMPEWDSPHQLQQGWEWRHLRPRQHLCLYSRVSAEALYEATGFTVIAFWRPLQGTLGKASWLLKPSDYREHSSE